MKIPNMSNILEKLYNDELTVYRKQTKINEDGTTSNELITAPIYEKIPCRISTSKVDNPQSNEEDINTKYLEIKVFCNPSYEIKKGDTLVCSRKNELNEILVTYKGLSNLPLVYISHQEITLAQVGEA